MLVPRPRQRALMLGALALGCAKADAPTNAVTQDPAPAAATSGSAAPAAKAEEPHLLGARAFVVTVYEKPSEGSKKLGYLRLGAKVKRSAEPVGRKGCKEGWYEIEPRGFVCAGNEAT